MYGATQIHQFEPDMVECVAIFLPEVGSVLILSRARDMAPVPDLLVTCGEEPERLIGWIAGTSERDEWLCCQAPWSPSETPDKNRIRVRSGAAGPGAPALCDVRYYASGGLGPIEQTDLLLVGTQFGRDGRPVAVFEFQRGKSNAPKSRIGSDQEREFREIVTRLEKEGAGQTACLGFAVARGRAEAGGALKVAPATFAWPRDMRRDVAFETTWWIDRVTSAHSDAVVDTPLREALRDVPRHRLEFRFDLSGSLTSDFNRRVIETALFVFHFSRSGAGIEALVRGAGTAQWSQFGYLQGLTVPTNASARYAAVGEAHTHEELGFASDQVSVDFADVRHGDLIAVISDPAQVRIHPRAALSARSGEASPAEGHAFGQTRGQAGGSASGSASELWFRAFIRPSTNEYRLVPVRRDEVDDGSPGFKDIVVEAEHFTRQAFGVERLSLTMDIRRDMLRPWLSAEAASGFQARLSTRAPGEFDTLPYLSLQSTHAAYVATSVNPEPSLLRNHRMSALTAIAARVVRMAEFARLQPADLQGTLAEQVAHLLGRALPAAFADPFAEADWIAAEIAISVRTNRRAEAPDEPSTRTAGRTTGRRSR